MQTADEVKMRATNLRESLVALGHPIKHGQCLDVISKLEGYADWNAYTAEEKYLVHFTEKVFLNEVRGIREDYGDYMSRDFLGCLIGDTDPETTAKYPEELRYLWRGVFEKNEALMVACIYCKDGTYHVSGFNLK